MTDYTINHEYFHNTGYSSLDPEFGNYAGLRNLNLSAVGSPTSIQTANQLNEVVSRIREGTTNVELQPIQAKTFEEIPKQHFQEVRALMNLTGVKPSVHAPMIDPSGYSEEGKWQGEEGLKAIEQQFNSIVERSHELDPKGNIPIVFHASNGIPGMEFVPEEGTKPGDKNRFKSTRAIFVDRETGELQQVKRDIVHYPGDENLEKGHEMIPEKQLNSVNATTWDQKITNLAFYKKHAEEILGTSAAEIRKYLDMPQNKIQEVAKDWSPEQYQAYNKLQDADIFLDNVRLSLNGTFDKLWKYGTPNQRKQLKELSEKHKDIFNNSDIEKVNSGKMTEEEYHKKHNTIGEPLKKMQAYEDVIRTIAGITSREGPPKLYQNIEEFTLEKASKTLGNVAFNSFKKYKDNTPIMAIENWQPGTPLSKAEDLKELVSKTRDNFIQNATKPKNQGGLGLSKSEADKQAKKFIGVTWDVGHINQFKKQGFTDEDIIQQTKTIAPMVKHVHLTDNFGYSDSHLVPGMGNVPFKQILEQMEKAGTLKDSRAIVEAGTVAVNFKTSPFKLTMEAVGSPIYGMSMAPYWNQAMGTQGAYFGMPHAYLPEKHFSTYGSSFSSLPQELGGQMPGTQSRFSGTPND